MNETLTFFIIAGESSGDRLGADLMQGLNAEHSKNTIFVGVGGPLMADQGLESIFPMDDLSVMGIAEIFPKEFIHFCFCFRILIFFKMFSCFFYDSVYF